jgi:hypothetical protein
MSARLYRMLPLRDSNAADHLERRKWQRRSVRCAPVPRLAVHAEPEGEQPAAAPSTSLPFPVVVRCDANQRGAFTVAIACCSATAHGALFATLAGVRWRVNQFPPVRFRRPAGILPLPVPARGGSIEALWPLLNLSSRSDFVLVVAWLLATLRPDGPYPLLAISGEQGSAKTVLSKMLKALIDPNVAQCGRCRARNASL